MKYLLQDIKKIEDYKKKLNAGSILANQEIKADEK